MRNLMWNTVLSISFCLISVLLTNFWWYYGNSPRTHLQYPPKEIYGKVHEISDVHQLQKLVLDGLHLIDFNFRTLVATLDSFIFAFDFFCIFVSFLFLLNLLRTKKELKRIRDSYPVK